MVKLLIGLNYKEFQMLIWKFIKGPNGCKIKTFERSFNHMKHYKMNAWMHLGFTYYFMHL